MLNKRDAPKVSVIVPCYNQSEFLDEALKSIFLQNYLNWECIIVDDGSTDQTKNVTNNWLTKDKRFKYIYQENQGLCSSRNTGIQRSSGEFILPLDADDKISLDYLSLAIKAFEKNKNLKLVYCLAEKFGVVNTFWNLKDFSLTNLAERNIIFSSAMFKKSDCLNLGGYDNKMVHGLEDWEFWINLLKKGGEVYRIEKICFYYRVKEVSMITNLTIKNNKSMLEYIHGKHKDFFIKNYSLIISKKNNEIRDLKGNLKSKKFLAKKLFKLIIK